MCMEINALTETLLAPMTSPATEQFSVRMPRALRRRMLDVIAATGTEITSSGLVVRAMETYLAILERNPSMLEGYDKRLNRSVTKKSRL